MKKNKRVILVLNDIYKRGTLRDYLLFLAQKERKNIQQDEINKLNKSDVISELSDSDECKCIRFTGGDKYYPNGCKIHPNG